MGVRIGRMKFRRVVVDNTPPVEQNDKLRLVVETTSEYTKAGILTATRDDTNQPIVIDWGDGTTNEVNGNISSSSNMIHTYTYSGTFNFNIKNINTCVFSNSSITFATTTSQNRYTLKRVLAMPDNLTRTNNYMFFHCDNITSITIGKGLTNINTLAFGYCINCTIFDFSAATQVPTLANVNAFSHTNANKKIIVPDALYDSWIDASNWSSTTNGIVTSIVRASDFNNQ